LTILPPEQSGVFLTAATIGVAIQWALGIAVAVARVKAGAPVPAALSEWFLSWGIRALWWPASCWRVPLLRRGSQGAGRLTRPATDRPPPATE
jgi:hypothetical protein